MLDNITQMNFAILTHQTEQDAVRAAGYRDEFYEQNSHAIKTVLRWDLRNYAGYDYDQINKMRLVSLDHYVSQFLSKRCNVYDAAPIIKTKDGKTVAGFDDLKELLEEVNINKIFQSNEHRAFLHNTILVHAKYSEELDKLFLENIYNIGSTRGKVFSYPGYALEPMVICYPAATPDNDEEWIIWDRHNKEHFKMKDEPRFDYETMTVVGGPHAKIDPSNPDESIGDYWPWVMYRMRDDNNDFWGNGFDALIDLVRTANILLSVCQEDVVYNALSAWILNFVPTGNKGDEGQLKSGPRNPWMRDGNLGNQSDPNGVILRAQLFVDEILRMVEELDKMLASMYNIDGILKAELEQNLSGVAMRLKNEPLLRDWKSSVEVFRKADKELLKMVIEANNYYRADRQINPAVLDEVIIDYQQPTVVTDEPTEYEHKRQQWEDGTSSPIEWVMSKNPEMTEKEAEQYIKDNKAKYKELFGITVNVQKDEDFDESGTKTTEPNKKTD